MSMMRRRVWVAAAAVAVLAAPGCGRKAPNAKAASPLIKLPSVLAAAEGCEWMRIRSVSSVVAPGDPAPIADQLKARQFVAEPMGGEWYILVRNDPAGRYEARNEQRPTTATAETTPEGEVAVAFTVPAGSRKALTDFSGKNLNRAVALTIDGLVYSAPNLQSKLSAAVLFVLPGSELEHARTLADRLARWQAVLSLRALVQPGENPDEGELRRKFRQIAAGATVKK